MRLCSPQGATTTRASTTSLAPRGARRTALFFALFFALLAGSLLAAPALARPARAAHPTPGGVQQAPAGQAQEPGAKELWDAGHRREAIELLADRLAGRPDDDELRVKLVRSELAVHLYAAALEHALPLGAAARAERGQALFHLARYEEALEWLDPDRPDETLLVADALEALGRFEGQEGADGTVDRAAQALGSDHPAVRVLSARRYERHGRDAEAAADYRAALAADPLDRAALFGLGQTLVRLGQVDEGRPLLERHRALIPLLDRLDDARRTVDMAPHHGPNHAALGDVLRTLGLPDESRDAYRAALARTDDEQRVPIALRLARLLREDRNNLEAAVGLLAEEARHPAAAADPRLHVRAGDYLMEVGRDTEALQHYLQAERMRPDDQQILERVERARRASGVGR